MYSSAQKQILLGVAKQCIAHGLEHGAALEVLPNQYQEALRETRASFVTLRMQRQLRGCIGTLEAYRPLVVDVSQNAYLAAFSDPRFSPLEKHEFADLKLSISVLTPSSEVTFSSEQDLISKLNPGEDGLILQDGSYRGTFLPSVWEQLPEKELFLQQLKIKAGLSADYWSDSIRVSRYHTESFE